VPSGIKLGGVGNATRPRTSLFSSTSIYCFSNVHSPAKSRNHFNGCVRFGAVHSLYGLLYTLVLVLVLVRKQVSQKLSTILQFCFINFSSDPKNIGKNWKNYLYTYQTILKCLTTI